MDIFVKIVSYFLEDPLRLLVLFGGSGGIVYWVNLYRNRICLKITLLDIGTITKTNPKTHKEQYCIHFKTENTGNTSTSLIESITLKGFIPPVIKKKPKRIQYRLKRTSYKYAIEADNRHLPPFQQKTFKAFCDFDDARDLRGFLRLMTYKFTPTLGRARRIRVRYTSDQILSYKRYLWELVVYIISGKLYGV